MVNISVKGLKPIIIKYVAMLVGICYVLNPLQEPIGWLLHEVSHVLESPTHLISHKSTLNFEHRSFNHYDVASYDLRHDHVMVDIVNTIFDRSNEKDNHEKSLLKEVKIDQHITVNQFKLQNPLKTYSTSTFWKLQKKSKCGYLEKAKKPPQYLLV